MGLLDLGREMKISQRPLDIIYVIDTSGSMDGAKIQSVNNAMHELEYMLREEAAKNPTAQVNVRVMTFGDAVARWHVDRTQIDQFHYQDINYVDGSTPLGAALNVLCDAVDNSKMPKRGLKPIIVLLSDGWPNDTWEPNLNRFLNLPWGNKALKVAIAIGKDADRDILAKFTTDRNLVLEANNPTDLKYFIKWTSTLVSYNTQHATQSRDGEIKAANIIMPKSAPPTMLPADSEDFT
jgi:uncharacterized protein YegL